MEQHDHEEAERDTNVPRDDALADAPAGKLHASCELNERTCLLSRLNEPSPRPYSFNIGRLKGLDEILGSVECNITHDSWHDRSYILFALFPRSNRPWNSHECRHLSSSLKNGSTFGVPKYFHVLFPRKILKRPFRSLRWFGILLLYTAVHFHRNWDEIYEGSWNKLQILIFLLLRAIENQAELRNRWEIRRNITSFDTDTLTVLLKKEYDILGIL